MTITTKYSIGDPVWNAEGVYQIPLQDIIFAIKLTYNDIGKIVTMYSFPGYSDGWIEEYKLFPTKDELVEHLNKQRL